LPAHTQLFVSAPPTLGLRRWELVAVLALAVAIAGLAGGAAGAPPSGLTRTALAAACAAATAALVASLVVVARCRRRAYDDAVRRGSWIEGILVFATGDVAIRFEWRAMPINQTIEFVSRADVESRCSLWRCRRAAFLRIYYHTIDARPAVATVCESELRDSIASVAAYINEVKGRNTSVF